MLAMRAFESASVYVHERRLHARFSRPRTPKFSPATSVGVRGCVSSRKTKCELWGQGSSTCEETLNLPHPHTFSNPLPRHATPVQSCAEIVMPSRFTRQPERV
eukprot:4669539-Prymnesium_polylepis.1